MSIEQELPAIPARSANRAITELNSELDAQPPIANSSHTTTQPVTMERAGLDALCPWPSFPHSYEPDTARGPNKAVIANVTPSSLQPTNYQPSYGCARCDGAGFYKLAVPVGHPQFGQLFPCVCTQAARERLDAERLQALDTQLLRYRDCRLVTFDLQRTICGPLQWQGQTFDVRQQQQALAEAQRIASAYIENPRGWLYLYGPPGSGKTRLAASIANEFRARHVQATYGRVQALLDWLKAGFREGEALDFDQRLRSLERTPLLLIDDLGTEHGTAWERVVLENLLNERYNRELPTVLTSNAWRDELPARIADRVAELATVIWLLVSSHRRIPLKRDATAHASAQPLSPWDRGEGEH